MSQKSNREYRSDVFSMMLQIPAYALDVYNVINDSNYTDSNLVEIIMLENGFSLSIRNDASFIIGTDLNIYEHQSSKNPNMALREILYFANIIQNYIKSRKLNLYGRKIVKIPAPRFVVFYNGVEICEEYEEYNLEDVFENSNSDIQIHMTAKVYNINPGNNDILKQKSYVLNGYCIFVEKIREYEAKMELDKAIDKAIQECIRDGIMSDFFREHEGEIKKVIKLDFSHERLIEFAKEESYQEGHEAGMSIGIEQGIEQKLVDQVAKKLSKGESIEEIACELEEPIEQIQKIIIKMHSK